MQGERETVYTDDERETEHWWVVGEEEKKTVVRRTGASLEGNESLTDKQ